jgi:glycosyltransferase involved in cell wall biosynthesis
VLPHIRILSSFREVDKIFLITIERNNIPDQQIKLPKTEHIPLVSSNGPFPLFNRILDFIQIPRYLANLSEKQNIELIIGRSSPAGALAFKVWEKTRIRFYVESFEPHADYMRESGVWNKWDLRYIFQKKWESRVRMFASGIITVSNHYKVKLLSEHLVRIPVEVAPCAVDPQAFKFNPQARLQVRKEYRIPDHWITGIYVGKFGDIYYDAEMFELFEITRNFFKGDFFLIIISKDEAHLIRKKLKDSGFPSDQALHLSADHQKIPDFLSAADFGFAPIREAPSRLYCSPVKIGEYWANGLPVLLTQGVGDESSFIEKEKGGVLFDIRDPVPALEKLKGLLKDRQTRQRIPELAAKYRSFSSIRNIYEKMICY